MVTFDDDNVDGGGGPWDNSTVGDATGGEGGC